MAPISNGLGGAAGTGVAKLFGLKAAESVAKEGLEQALKVAGKEVLEEVVEETGEAILKTVTKEVLEEGAEQASKGIISRILAKQGTEYVLKEGAEATAKTTIGKIASYATDMAVDGAFSGATDGFARAAAEGRWEDIPQEMLTGGIGGFFASPIIGGGFRVATKAGSTVINKINNKITIGSLLPDGTMTKFSQGEMGDCALLSMLDGFLGNSKTAKQIQNAITTSSDGGYNVKIGSQTVKIAREELTDEMLSDTTGIRVFELAYQKAGGSLDGEFAENVAKTFGLNPVHINSDGITDEVLETISKDSNNLVLSLGARVDADGTITPDGEFQHYFSIKNVDPETRTLTLVDTYDTSKTFEMSFDDVKTQGVSIDGGSVKKTDLPNVERSADEAGFKGVKSADIETQSLKISTPENMLLSAGFEEKTVSALTSLNENNAGIAIKLKNVGLCDFSCVQLMYKNITDEQINALREYKTLGLNDATAYNLAINNSTLAQAKNILFLTENDFSEASSYKMITSGYDIKNAELAKTIKKEYRFSDEDSLRLSQIEGVTLKAIEDWSSVGIKEVSAYEILLSDDIDKSLQTLSLDERIKVAREIEKMPTYKIPELIKWKENLLSQIRDLSLFTINTTPVSKEATQKMMSGFFANNNPQLDNLLSTTDFSQFGKSGLPLEYSRQAFISDLSETIKDLPETEQADILKKLGITLTNNEDVIGYDGIIDLSKLSQEGVEGDVLSLATKFIKENSISTGDRELDEALNSLIQGMPEFINIIGKQQHQTQDFSVDIHLLTVLKEAMSNPNYQNLSNQDKFCLKFATILHDIAKSEGIVDDGHAELCALYVRDILNKDTISLPVEMKDRIYELVKNHHWLADYNKGNINKDKVAALYRRTGDLEIAQIMAEADLKGVKADGSFYESHRNALDDDMQIPIQNALININSQGQMFLTNKIIDSSKVPAVIHNGIEYQVINFTQLAKSTDLQQYGFEPGTTADNFRIFVHAVDDNKINSLEIVYDLKDPSHQSLLCTSYISIEKSATYGGYRFGVSLETEQVNIANASNYNQASGIRKNFTNFSDIITGNDKGSQHRTLIPAFIKEKLNLSTEEYSEFFTLMQKYKYTSQLESIPNIQIGNKTYTGKEIKEIVLQADDLMLSGEHNEANLYSPKVNAVIAKVNSLDKVPQNLLDFAQEHNLPIYLLGE